MIVIKTKLHQHILRTVPGKVDAWCCPFSGLPLAPKDVNTKPRQGSPHILNAKISICGLTRQDRKEKQVPSCPPLETPLEQGAFPACGPRRGRTRNCSGMGYHRGKPLFAMMPLPGCSQRQHFVSEPFLIYKSATRKHPCKTGRPPATCLQSNSWVCTLQKVPPTHTHTLQP